MIELQTLHARDLEKIEEAAIFDGGELSCKEKGLLIEFRWSCGGDPKRLNVECCSTGLRKIDKPSSFDCKRGFCFLDFKSSSSTKLKPKSLRKKNSLN